MITDSHVKIEESKRMINSSNQDNNTKFTNPFDSNERLTPPQDDNAPNEGRKESTLNHSKTELPNSSSQAPEPRPRRSSVSASVVEEEEEQDGPTVAETGQPKFGKNGPRKGSLVGQNVNDDNPWGQGSFINK